ncbi:transglycosylase SLT domain-containing protein [Lichenifustis flavocetrariae]|uniref:Transglycosylase SLT domain-containing protein n=1 Tax=Lichenifustis flavocetrariae TaxID=2949735 RepID=A0AA41Z5Z8_9HYPH|nr:transglycosylase SLT domain-containing protein [Lichenifustis flavocetrariae]MCW6510960.1 transglycosylase SLT domain-containing protein [Lichenifustis flavocetrariae]
MPYLNTQSGLGGFFDALTSQLVQRRQAQSAYDAYAQAQGAQPLSADRQPGFFDRLIGAFSTAPLDTTSKYAAAASGTTLSSAATGQNAPAPATSTPGTMAPPAPPMAYTSPVAAPSLVSTQSIVGPAPVPPASPPTPAGPLPSMASAQGVPQSGGLQGLFTSAAQNYSLPPGYLPRLAAIESSFNQNAVSPTGAAGPYQFTKGTAAQYGLADPTNWADSTDAAARLTADNAASLTQALGRTPTAGELYLAHQQGAAGAAKLLANPTARAGDVVGDKAVRVNGGDPNMTAGQFAGMWMSKFGDPGPVAQSAIAAGFNTPFNGQPIGPNPNGFTPPQSQDPGLPTMAASGMGTQLPNATPFPIARMSPSAARLASSSAGQPIQPAPGGDNTPDQPTSLASTGSSPGSTQQVTGAPPSQPYGSVPLNVGGQMLTRQQAENADGFDHTDYDAAAAKAGLIPSAATAPPFGDGGPSVAAPSSSSRSAGTAVALTPATAAPSAVSPPPAAGAPTSSNAAFSITPTMIGALIKNPDTQQFGLQLWQHMLTTKSQPQIAHSGDWILDANGRPLYQIPDKPELTDTIKNYQYAAGQGYTGGFTQYQSDQQKADKAQLVDIPLPNGQFQKAWALPGQNPTPANYVGTPYTRQPANQVTIDQKAESSQEGEYGKAVGQEIGETVKAGASAPQALNQIAMMRAAAARAGDNLSTGPFGTWTLKAKQAISNALGIEIPGTSEGEVINNIGYGLAKQAARAISNRPTQFEFGQPLAVKPGLSLSPQGMQAVLNIREQDLRDQVALARLASVKANRDNWAAVKADYYDQHPVMSPFDPSQPLGAGDVQAINDSVQGRQSQSISAQEASALPVVSSPEAAARLKPGTMFKTPDGRIKQR